MSGVNPPTPVSFSNDLRAVESPEQMLKLLELELAQKRASRLARESAGRSRTLPALCVLLLFFLLGAAFFAVWRVQTLHDTRRSPSHVVPPAPTAGPAARPR